MENINAKNVGSNKADYNKPKIIELSQASTAGGTGATMETSAASGSLMRKTFGTS